MKTFTTLTAALLLMSGCQSEQSAAPEATTAAPVTTPVSFNTAGAPTAALHVPGMFCEFSCVEKVKQVLAEQSGVKEVKIDFETKTATVAIDKAVFDADGAIAALVDYQFMDTELISGSKATTVSASYEQ